MHDVADVDTGSFDLARRGRGGGRAADADLTLTALGRRDAHSMLL
jgi:hypothetical protein